MDTIKVLVLSSVVPNALGSGGELVLHRYLKSNGNIQCEVISWKTFPLRLKVIGKLREIGLQSLSRAWECSFPPLPSMKMVRESIQSFRPDVVVTVAHGWWHMQARNAAKEFGLPLVSFFQDWWPDFPEIPLACRSRVEREFRETCAESVVAICVSDGMRRELAEPPNALVLHDIPSVTMRERSTSDFTLPLRVAYFGNLSEYGPLIESAVRIVDGSDHVRLEVFGPSPLWTSGSEDEFRAQGIYRGFIPADQLAKSLEGFQAVLVVMSFDPALRRRMTTSFPSKMIDAMQLGLPVVIWGPEYCSAVTWSRGGERALCVTDSNPSAMRQTLEELAASPLEQERLSKSARKAAVEDFNPERIQAQFMSILGRVICRRNASNRVTSSHEDLSDPS